MEERIAACPAIKLKIYTDSFKNCIVATARLICFPLCLCALHADRWLLRSLLFVALNTINVLSSRGATCLFYLFKQIFFIVFNCIFLPKGYISGRSYGAFFNGCIFFLQTDRPSWGYMVIFFIFPGFFQKTELLRAIVLFQSPLIYFCQIAPNIPTELFAFAVF